MADETTGTSTATTTDTGAGEAGTQTPNAGQPPHQADSERKFTQADLDAAISNRMARERKATEERTAAERQKAELAQLAAKAEWEEIAKQHEQTVRELQPQLDTYKTRLETLSERLNRQIEQGIRDWPAEARKMVPASEDVAARLDAYENMRNLLDGGRLNGRQPGNGTGPRPTAGPAASEKTEELLRSNPRYSAL
jgi:uncharacterized protein YPO0396